MEKYLIDVERSAKKELQKHFKSGDKSTIKRIEQIFTELEQNPCKGVENPKQLRHSLSDYWSRKINKKDRLIYRIDNHTITVVIVSAMGHYDDK